MASDALKCPTVNLHYNIVAHQDISVHLFLCDVCNHAATRLNEHDFILNMLYFTTSFQNIVIILTDSKRKTG